MTAQHSHEIATLSLAMTKGRKCYGSNKSAMDKCHCKRFKSIGDEVAALRSQ
jgi:hypothetical protein